jgi:hypothetical protein
VPCRHEQPAPQRPAGGLRPDLEIRSIRGNVDTRFRKVTEGEYDAACSPPPGFDGSGSKAPSREWLADETMLPAPGQGALAIQCRADDEGVLALLAELDDAEARARRRPNVPSCARSVAAAQLRSQLWQRTSRPLGCVSRGSSRRSMDVTWCA